MTSKLAFSLASAITLAVAGCSPDPKQALITKAEQSVRQSLKDPDSAEFSDVQVKGVVSDDLAVAVVCGQVNAKNSFGGYVGYRRFYFLNSSGTSDIASGDATKDAKFGFDVMWSRCESSEENSN